MNALYVTVSVPLLLILAGFNHAHGLSTFGKTSNNQANTETVQGNPCENHMSCNGVNGTSCVKNHSPPSQFLCLCGNNKPPNNGLCPVTKKGPNHQCTMDDECVRGAQCQQSKTPNIKTCICTSNPSYIFDCNGTSMGNTISALALVLTLACKILY